MLFLFVSVVRKNRPQVLVFARIDALVVPVNGLEFFHEGNYCSVHIAGLGRQLFYWFVIANAGHSLLLVVEGFFTKILQGRSE